jgi:hypothetical protein
VAGAASANAATGAALGRVDLARSVEQRGTDRHLYFEIVIDEANLGHQATEE